MCAPGYWCISGSGTPTPDGSDPTSGVLCPFGYYCERGTTEPQQCDSGLVISVEGASSKLNCTQCPKGYICTNSTIPLDCPAGYYCPENADITPCPPGTFSDTIRAEDDTVCLPCTPGYWCVNEATTTPEQNPCPVGHYCPEGTGGSPSSNSSLEPVPCPPGTYRDQVGGASLSDCSLCPFGFYCPNATIVCFNCTDSAVTGELQKRFFYGKKSCFGLLFTGIPCEAGSYCEEGSTFPSPCDASYYCPNASIKIECPAGRLFRFRPLFKRTLL